MISLLNFIDTGFIITLGLLLLVSGTVMLYCYRRLNVLENSVIEHGKILQNFIINYNQTMQYSNMFKSNNETCYMSKNDTNVSDDTLDNVDTENVKNIQIDKKICISDNSDSDSDDDISNTDNNTSSDSEDMSDNEDTNDNNKIIKNTNQDTNTNITNDNDLSMMIQSDDSVFFNNSINIDEIDMSAPIHSITSKVINLDNDNTSINVPDKLTFEKRNFSKMRVDELRVLVVTKNLIDNENAQQMKKNDLVKLLQH